MTGSASLRDLAREGGSPQQPDFFASLRLCSQTESRSSLGRSGLSRSRSCSAAFYQLSVTGLLKTQVGDRRRLPSTKIRTMRVALDDSRTLPDSLFTRGGFGKLDLSIFTEKLTKRVRV